ncbi:GTP 3',8-cyclase MoaA [Lachnoclostridium sp. An14]|uniref:GTP 3',8-cyclase MoaA n=1 Tax=Lachnoclostridium sp. An14 TaxID=1965562 RepID=UPI000B38B8A2|nr:GTP 3',8-cyclase MoaA [Lachnoclostridium sp. An14]OUQ15870.1 GTP 3',8-cyclase MoaA [Lachnoclostridium sp. An14]
MRDQYGRDIHYLRISVTDRCNLRCAYCMPEGIKQLPHGEILRYEEILRICRQAVKLGICHFKVTGGEPLVRRGILDFLRELKAMDGAETVTLTTNGLLLSEAAGELAAMNIDGVNISLDTAGREDYAAITGRDAFETVDRAIREVVRLGIPTKCNCVLLSGGENRILPVVEYARRLPVDVRFIELMPIGAGAGGGGLSAAAAREILGKEYPDLAPAEEKRGFGPARYEASARLKGRIGWIDAVSHSFCQGCNRVRLTSTGLLKPCLCYGDGTDVKSLLRGGCGDEELKTALAQAIYGKPRAHCFDGGGPVTESHTMAEIGG